MNIVLTDKPLQEELFPKDTVIKTVTRETLRNYNGDPQVTAIAGSRAMAIQCADMDFPSLRLFQLTSAGFDGVPLAAYAEKGIPVANAGTVYSAPIAETVVFGMLTMAKKLRQNPNNRRFKLTRGYRLITELKDKKILIMGAGNIGTAVAERLLGFEAQIEGYDPYCKEKPQYRRILRTREELLANLGTYDYIISTLPDNEETNGFINATLLKTMKPSAVIINVGRKAVFQQKELYNALKKSTIGGAVLDHFEKIPNPLTNPFRRLSNVVILPGVAAISNEVNFRLSAYMSRNIKAALNGDPISNVINGVK